MFLNTRLGYTYYRIWSQAEKTQLSSFSKLSGLIGVDEANDEGDHDPEYYSVKDRVLIPLIEYFDAQNVTIRIGDIRKLRKG